MTYTTTDLHNFLKTRRSVRRFKPDPVPASLIEQILVTATYAPSAHHRQPWRFVVVTDLSFKARLADAMAEDFERDLLQDDIDPEKIQAQIKRSKERITSAPVVILLCLDRIEMDAYPDTRRQQAEQTMAIQSIAAAGLQLLLAAHAGGLGGVWVCSPLFTQETIKSALDLPETWEPQGMFFVGYAAQNPAPRERKNLESISLFF